MAAEFIMPDFISGNDPEQIQERMMKNLPAGIDDMPGGFPYDFTMPTALEISELIQFHLVRTTMLMFPQFAWGEWLDLHGQQIGLVRKTAKKASGIISVTGKPGVIIQKGFVFCTESINGGEEIKYGAAEKAEIPETGTAEITVEALLPGAGSNVAAGKVNMVTVPLAGIHTVTNKKTIEGGTDEETDEAYYGRISDYNASIGASFVGNHADYIRWAKKVQGVGAVDVIPEWDGPGTVKVVLMGDNGEPVKEEILEAVYNDIISPEYPLERKAPIGAKLTVSGPAKCPLSYLAEVLRKEEYSLEKIVSEFSQRLENYYREAKNDGVVRYSRISAILTETSGVQDFSGLRINNQAENIVINADAYPGTTNINFTVSGEII